MATFRPASSSGAMASAACAYPAARTAASRDMANESGRTVFPPSSAAPCAMESASISPEAVCGAAITGQASSTAHASRVIHMGSPGPTPTA